MSKEKGKYFIVALYFPDSGKTTTLWIVMIIPHDIYKPGDTIPVNGKEYVLGKQDIDGEEVVSYELIPKQEVLELE